MMNWLFLAVAVVLGYHAVDGFCKGFIRKAVSAVSLILTLVLVTYVNPYITTFIQNYTPIHENLQEKCSELFAGNEYNEALKTDQVLIIENMELPENLKTLLIENNNTEVYELLDVSGFHDYVGAYLANMIVNAMSYLIAFLVVFTLLRVVLMALDVVTMLPLLHGINKLAGIVLGLTEGVIFVWIAFLLVTILCNGSLGQRFFELIRENQFLLFLYNQNVIAKIVFGLIF